MQNNINFDEDIQNQITKKEQSQEAQSVNYLGAQPKQDTFGNQQDSDLYAPMYIPINKKEMGYSDNIELIAPDELREQTIHHKLNRQSILPSYEGAQEQKGVLGTGLDMLKGVGEGAIDGLVVGSWLGFWCDEDTINAFETRTAAGDFVHALTKYAVVGALALTGASATGTALKVAKNLAGKNLFSKAAKGTAEFILKDSPHKWARKNLVADAFVNKIFSPRNTFQGIYADYMGYNPKEGHLADILQVNNIGAKNPYSALVINALSSNQEDTITEAKLKNVFEGLLLAPVVGLATDLTPIIWKKFKNVITLSKDVKKTKGLNSKEISNLADGVQSLNTTLRQDEVNKKCQLALAQSIKNGSDPQEELRKFIPESDLPLGDKILSTIQSGDKIISNEDGSSSIKIDTWTDGFKVSRNEFEKQLMSGEVSYTLPNNQGSITMPKSTAEQNNALYEILEKRGISHLENETESDFLNKVVQYYKSADKWNIQDNVKLSFPHKIDGEGANGNHFGHTKYIEDKKGNLKNIEIEIKKDAPNKLAILRAELEHVRDKVAGVRDLRQEGQEFYRYGDSNEQSWATTYLHKKSVSNALRDGKNVPENVLENYKTLNNEKNYLDYQIAPEELQSYDKEAVSNFYKELEAAKKDLNPQNVKDFENIFKYKLDNLEELPSYIKEVLEDEINKSANNFYDAAKNLENNTNIEKAAKAIEGSQNIQQADMHTNELLKNTDLENPENAQKLVRSYAKDYKTRNFDEAVSDAKRALEYISKHITPDVLKTKDIKDYLNPDMGARKQLNDELLAYSRVLNNTWELIKESHAKIEANPYDVEEYFIVRRLLQNYNHLEDTIIKETSQMGLVFNELKLSDTRGAGFKKIYTEKQRRQKDKVVQVLTRAYKNISEDFFTVGSEQVNNFADITNNFYKFIKANEIDLEPIEIEPERMAEYAKYIEKNTKGKTKAERERVMQDVFEIHTQMYDLSDYLKGAIESQNITGFSAFKKYFASNLAHNYVSSILSSPATQVANVLSGGFNMILEDAMKFTTGLRTGNARVMKEVQYTIEGQLRSLGQSLKVAVDTFKREEGRLANTRRYGLEIDNFAPIDKNAPKPLSANSLGLTEDTPLACVFNTFGNILRLPSRAMGTADEFMTHSRYYGNSWADAKLKAEEKLGIENPPHELLDAMAQELIDDPQNYFDKTGLALRGDLLYSARKNLYQQNLDRTIYNPNKGYAEPMERSTSISDFGLALEKIRGMSPAITFITPFVRTPTNIIEQLSEYTPATMFTNKYKMLEGFEKQLANTKIAFGSAAVTLCAMMATQGTITGSTPINDEERKALTQSGWQPYSFVLTNPDGSKRYYSYKKLEPLASIVGLGADTTNLINAGLANDKDVGHLVTLFSMLILNNALDKSYLNQSIETLSLLNIASENDANKLQRVMGNFVTGNIPYSSAANWFKNDGVAKEMRTFLDVVRQRNPFVTNNGVMPNRNYFGETRSISGRGENLITRETRQINDSADSEILRLSQNGYEPYRPLRILGDAELDMTQYGNSQQQTAYDRLLQEMSEVRLGGKTLREATNELVQSSNYQDLPDGVLEDEDQLYKTKKQALNKLIKKYSDQAKKNVLNSQEFANSKNLDLKTAQGLWKKSRRMSRVVDINGELNAIF